ncbi:MAG: hypothetical protein IJ617_04550 [Oscillospiraceae bacterium]|nr:hypothetical protein [Oscillospiraceae bacterium]
MDFSTIGSINQYAKGAALKMRWELKQKSGDVTSHNKSLSDFLSVGGPTPQTLQDSDDVKLQQITSKVNAGTKLTKKEMEYLKEKNPRLYEKLRRIEEEQKEYEEDLRRCKSRDEAQRMHLSRVGEVMQAAKDGDETAVYRLNRLTESMIAFTKSRKYKGLPTESEQALERKEERDARMDKLRQAFNAAMQAQKPAVETENAALDVDAKAKRPDYLGAETAGKEKTAEAGSVKTASEHRLEKTEVRFGTLAYVTSQKSEERETRRRSKVDTEA